MASFAQKFVDAVKAKKTLLMLGMDPDFQRIARDFGAGGIQLADEPREFLAAQPLIDLVRNSAAPDEFKRSYELLLHFGAQNIYALRDEIIGVKFQLAYFEEAGPLGLHALAHLAALCRELGLLVLMDAKRGDIGSTFARYLNAYLSPPDVPLALAADAMTVNPLVGTDTWELFVKHLQRGKGIILLTYPTAPGAEEIMNARIGEVPLYLMLASAAFAMVRTHGLENDPANLGLVVGALRQEVAEDLRLAFPGAIFLVPGVGAQGGTMDAAAAFAGPNNYAIFPVSRGLLYNYADAKMPASALAASFWQPNLSAAQEYNQQLRAVLKFG
jgi:orotidine-5'-phosphate decarboxylase